MTTKKTDKADDKPMDLDSLIQFLKDNGAEVQVIRLDEGENPFANAPVISSYTRKQAIEDGIIFEATQFARSEGFRVPVGITAAVMAALNKDASQLQDLLYAFYRRVKAEIAWARDMKESYAKGYKLNEKEQDRLTHGDRITLAYAFADGTTRTLWGICGPGDNDEPVVTIMFPEDY